MVMTSAASETLACIPELEHSYQTAAIDHIFSRYVAFLAS